MRLFRTIPGFLCALFPLVAGAARADEAPPFQGEVTYVSRSVFRGVERAGDSVQAGAKLSRENLHGGLWLSQPFDNAAAREAKLQAGYVWTATDGLSVEASLAHSWFDRVSGGGVNRSLEAGLAATLAPAGGFTPRLSYHHDFRFRADAVEMAFARSIALTRIGAFLELNLFAGYARGRDWRPDAAGSRRRDDYGWWGGEVALPYRIGAHSTVVAGIHYAETFGRSVANGPFGRSGNLGAWVSLGVNLDF